MFYASVASTSRALRIHGIFNHSRHGQSLHRISHPQFISARFLPRISRTGGPSSLGARHKHHHLDAGGVVEESTISFRKGILNEDPSYGSGKFAEGGHHPPVLRQVLFVIGGTVVAFNVAAYLTERDTEYWANRLRATRLWQVAAASSEDMRRARMFQLAKTLQAKLKEYQEMTFLPLVILYPILWTYAQAAEVYLNTTEGKRLAYTICGVNGIVWALWQIPKLQTGMIRSFMHYPLSGLSYTLVTSLFSHKSFVHLLFNSLALTSFGSAAAQFLIREQSKNQQGIREASPRWHFLATFVSAGLFSGLVSHIVNARIIYPHLVSKALSSSPAAAVSAASASTTNSASTFTLHSTRTANIASRSALAKASKDGAEILPSLGASGGIYALVTMTALAYPDSQVYLLFPPIPLPISVGVGGMICLDILGVIRGWRMFDHWAHLGGAAFGAAYYTYGPSVWNGLREKYHYH